MKHPEGANSGRRLIEFEFFKGVPMVNLVGISGSLREGSLNSALLRAAVDHMPEGAALSIGTISGIPLYDGDLETESGIPDAVAVLKDQIAAADGLLLVTPEYNNSMPGVFKNAIDWLSRPSSDIANVFGAKPVAIIGASPSGFGTILSQSAWLPVMRTLGADLWSGGRLMVARAGSVFDADRNLVDDKVEAHLAEFLAGFSAYVEARK
jgi:chromate reductase, NAD(P)H dehydrogenase (quinone)